MDQTDESKAFPWFAKLVIKAKKKVESTKKQPSEPKPAPKQGHHIINKGVINIYEDVIRRFVCDNQLCIFKGQSYDNLMKMKVNFKDDEEKKALDFLYVKNPLSSDLKKFIQDTTVSEKDETGGDKNAEQFGLAKLILITCANSLMLEIYNLLLRNKANIISICQDYLMQLRRVIEKYFKFSSGYAFVDQPALKEWKKKNKTKKKENEIKGYMEKVWEMIEDIVKCENEELEQIGDVTPLVVKWGEGAFWVTKVFPLH